MTAAAIAAEAAARTSYGRLLAFLTARSRDVAAAEDALAEALRQALETWPARGVPDNPDAWLLVVARRGLARGARQRAVRSAAEPTLALLADVLAPDHAFPDERLPLLFVCAHPAIAVADRAPMMLQVVLGLDAARIASAFLVSPAAMGQRLSRAKAAIRQARLRFEIPSTEELPDRLEAVLDAIYAAYGSGWEDIAGADPRRRDLATEALLLARLIAGMLPLPEARGLLALILHCEARRPARRDSAGCFVPLGAQDPALWQRALIEEAEANLAEAAKAHAHGRFQLEAAIQSAHAARAVMGQTPWRAIAALYAGLVGMTRALGARVGHAAAVAEADGAAAGWRLLAALPAEDVVGYQPYWALRTHLLTRLARPEEAAAARSITLGLTEDPAVRAFLAAPLA